MRRPSHGAELAKRAAEERLPISISAMDVDSDVSVKDGIGAILRNGSIDVLVNNAGIERTGDHRHTHVTAHRTVG
jgi:NAD(P)-dependent dehydrogenase (short-subunit alcohol dehydrogenase family)